MSTNENPPLALIIDDEQSICQSLAGVLTDEGWKTQTAQSGVVGIQTFRKNRPDIVFVDVWMPNMDGIETLQKMKAIDGAVPIIVMSGHGNIETAVKATKSGAINFLEKPLALENVLPLLDQALKLRKTSAETLSPSDVQTAEIIGECEQITNIRMQISKVAPRDAWVLITGENGTGKEVVARSVHNQSARAAKPFVAVNCAAIPESLLESELFGHVKGAFTNAISHKTGKFELAHKGTIFLDEIADMSLKNQAKVLRVLEQQELQRVGDSQMVHVDVRVIAATNKNLMQAIKDGQFREDLFYRLNVIPFALPPLRERGEDVVLLVKHFSEKIAQQMGEEKKEFSKEVLDALREYHWPGNVRELKNLLERLYIMVSEKTLLVSHLPDTLRQNSDSSVFNKEVTGSATTLRDAKSEFERLFIVEKLKENNWNVSKTAENIGLERSNLHRKLKLYKIDTKQTKNE